MENKSESGQIRIWAHYAGIPCPPDGEIPDTVLQYYQKAHRNAPIPPAEFGQPPFLPRNVGLCPLVIRTDFSDESAWHAVVAAIRKPAIEGVEVLIDLCEDPAFADLTPAQLLGHLPDVDNRLQHQVLFVVDALTIRDPEHPLIAINLVDEPGGKPGSWARVIPSAVQVVGANIDLGNMWFWSFVFSTGPDGIIR